MAVSCEWCKKGWPFTDERRVHHKSMITSMLSYPCDEDKRRATMESSKGYTCKDCNRTYETARDFCDHFKREETSEVIVGCKGKEKVDG